ncbi:MAG: CHAT domain-containing protein [Myxococcota bacterium]|jgi:CHAT domain-containing protein
MLAAGTTLGQPTVSQADVLDQTLANAEAALRRGAYREALALAGTINADAARSDHRRQSAALTVRAQVLSDLGQLDDARLALEAALAELAGTPHTDGLIAVLVALGEIAYKQGDTSRAASAFNEAKAWNDALNGQHRAASIEHALARLAGAAGHHAIAREHYRAALQVCPKKGTNTAAGCRIRAEIGLAQIALLAGLPSTARRGFDDVLASLHPLDRDRDQAVALLGSARAHLALGDTQLAAHQCAEALTIARRIKHRAILADSHVLSGELARHNGRFETARGHLKTAFDHYQAMRSMVGMARSRVVLASLLATQGDVDGAVTQLTSARARYRALGDRQGLIQTTVALAELARAAGDQAREKELLIRSLSHDPSRTVATQAHTRLGALAKDRGDSDTALHHLRLAAGIADTVPTHRLADAARGDVLAKRAAAYDALLQTLLPAFNRPTDATNAHVAEALAASERSVARDFVDVLERARLRRDAPDTARLLNAIETLDAQQRRLDLATPGAARRVSQLATERGRLERELLGLRVALTPGDPLATHRLDQAVDAVATHLRPDVALLKFHVTDRGGVLFVVTSGGVKALPLPPRETLAKTVRRFVGSLEQPTKRTATQIVQKRDARRLYDALLAPALPHIGDRTRLVIVPHLEIRLVPFDALVIAPKKATREELAVARARRTPVYALDRFTISYAPSLAALHGLHQDALRRKGLDRHPLLAFADPVYTGSAVSLPRLTASASEVRAARDHIVGDPGPGTLFLREEASEARLKSLALNRYAIVHLATHGYAPDRVTADVQPALFLSRGQREDGVLRLDEVLDLRLDADLVVLSACNSGRGELQPGDGLGALTRAFLYAGTSAVMATLWAVEDQHASQMMGSFYADLGRGATTPDALRASRLALLNGQPGPKRSTALRMRGIGGVVGADEPPSRRKTRTRRARSADPFFWAAYVLIGESGDILR